MVARLVTGRVRAHSCVRETCVRRLHAAWGVTISRSSLPFPRGCRVGVWFGSVGAALLPAVGSCVVLAFGAMPGRCCFLRVTHMYATRARQTNLTNTQEPSQKSTNQSKEPSQQSKHKAAARSSSEPTKPNQTPSSLIYAKDTPTLDTANPKPTQVSLDDAHCTHAYREAAECTRPQCARACTQKQPQPGEGRE